ncbi:ATR-interacting protein [Liparis tanakae]|uniref:ATR-interacting protein n=1 Tax=Liparis tanakae TaxID=230148 RepID=A0A4Z2FVY7_9TELE|nr:ATR-interacting protein [Liparis tanakae]
MNCPPTKRLRGLDQDVVAAFDDPFGDDDDFTQDDLDEMDTIASQAITAVAAAGLGTTPAPRPTEPARGSDWPQWAGQSKCVSGAAANQSGENAFGSGSNRGNAGLPGREPLGNRQQRFGSDREDSHGLLEAQHAELKRKLKEVEEEIVLKSGEIRVLRDSLRGAQQEKEAQRQNQMLQEAQRQREQSDKEKELNKKVLSLKSELQFKEAEINEMKTKLHSSDKPKMASPLPRNSPKVLGSLAPLHPGSGGSSPSPTANGFITKETFGAHVPPRAARRDGGVLLGLLLQQPLSPSSLGLSHLLSMSPSDVHLTSSKSAGFLLRSDAAVGDGGGDGAAPRATLSPLQSLAVTGLNTLSQNRPAAGSGSKRSCPGAVLFLPLLELHLSRLCGALDSLRSVSGSNSAAGSPPAGGAAGAGRLDEAGVAGFSVEDAGLAALRLLYLLVAHSDEVVEAVLTKEDQSRVTDVKTEPSAAGVALCSQNALLQAVLRLCEAGLAVGSQREELALDAMKTLCVLIQRTPHTHGDRLQCVLQVVCVCLSADCRLQTVSGCVSVLRSVSDHPALARRLCSQHDPCVFLKLLQFIRTRADSRATHTDWVQLDLQVVRLLSRLMTQRAESWTSSQHGGCPCYTELVQTVVILFHRQWLDLRGSRDPTDSTGSSHLRTVLTDRRPESLIVSLPSGRAPPSHQGPAPCGAAASLLRECLLLLHWLLLHHGSFSENCRPLLHMYDQLIPAVRDTLRGIPGLSESEELALEEICRSEGDDTDDMDTDTGS